MMCLTYGTAELTTGDDIAIALIAYAVLLAKTGSSDAVTLTAVGDAGYHQQATIVLGPATMLMSRPVTSEFSDPDNTIPLAYMEHRTLEFTAY